MTLLRLSQSLFVTHRRSKSCKNKCVKKKERFSYKKKNQWHTRSNLINIKKVVSMKLWNVFKKIFLPDKNLSDIDFYKHLGNLHDDTRNIRPPMVPNIHRRILYDSKRRGSNNYTLAATIDIHQGTLKREMKKMVCHSKRPSFIHTPKANSIYVLKRILTESRKNTRLWRRLANFSTFLLCWHVS